LAVCSALIGLPAPARAQKNCEGHEPEGGKWTTSAELYLQKARQNPDPQEKQELFREAVEVLRDGYQYQTENPRLYAMAGQAYAGLGEYQSADTAFSKAEELWSCYEGHVDTLRFNAWVVAFNTAVRYAQSQENEKAAEAYQNAWSVYKDLPQPMIQLGGIYAQQAMNAENIDDRTEAQKKAIVAFENALKTLEDPSPRLTEDKRSEYGRAAAFNLAQLLAFDGRYEEAAQAYERFLEQEPGNIDALSNLAVVVTRAASEAEKQAGDLEVLHRPARARGPRAG
jgi:tetratricopeptide (TPR) repeat protein